MSQMTLFPLTNLPLVAADDNIANLIVDSLETMQQQLQEGDIVVIVQKIVSKAEGRVIPLPENPDERARKVAVATDKEPRFVAAVLQDSTSIVHGRRGMLVVRQKSGWTCSNAGIDRSNVGVQNPEECQLALLPEDADASARKIRDDLLELTGVAAAVLINDSFGRPWRLGTVGVCIGCAGLAPIWDQRGRSDLFGYQFDTSEECIADELSAAATLVMGQGAEGNPVVIVRGYELPNQPPQPATTIQRGQSPAPSLVNVEIEDI